MAKELTIYDRRRVCTDMTLYLSRKNDKTGMAAYVQFLFFFFGDANAEIVCCANSKDQATILYRRTTDLLRQMDNGEALRINASVADWKPAYRGVRKSELRPLSAGGKAKDGMFCQLVVADEFGSAAYINGKADMSRLVDVCRSSMGPRREPLTLTTTTAGVVTAGPFIDKLEGLHRMLERELDYDDGTLTPSAEEDRTMCLLFEVDEWERDEDYALSHPHLWAKVAPALGVMVQRSFYESEVQRAKMEQSARGEVLSKLFNIYSQGKISMWMKGDKIIPLQRDRRITDCRYADGYSVWVGMDYSNGNDFFAISYLAVNYNHQGQTMAGLMFADTEAWILEETLKDSPNRALFEKWVEQGWLQVCPGAVFDSGLAIARLMEKHQQGVNLCGFGYDPAQSKQPINNLKAWLQTLGIDARTIEQMVIPVSQSAMTFNSVIADMEDYILAPVPWMEFSNNPMWNWQLSNCAVELGRTDLRRLVKGNGQANKIDSVMALGNAVYLFALSEGKIEGNG